jgi:hypothetical protein
MGLKLMPWFSPSAEKSGMRRWRKSLLIFSLQNADFVKNLAGNVTDVMMRDWLYKSVPSKLRSKGRKGDEGS